MSAQRSGVELGAFMLALVVAACGGVANDAREPAPPADSTNESPMPAVPEPESDDGMTPEPSAEPEPSASPEEPVAQPNVPVEADDVYMERLFDEYCVACHAGAGSVAWVIGQGWLIPGLPDRSPAFQVMAAPEGPHSDRPWPVEDDLLLICDYVARGPDDFECTPEGLVELRRSLD